MKLRAKEKSAQGALSITRIINQLRNQTAALRPDNRLITNTTKAMTRQQVDQASSNVKAESEKPQNQQNHEDRPKHRAS